jgi:hypothetical protein
MSDHPQQVRKRLVLANWRQPYAHLDQPPRERARDRRAGMSPGHLVRIRQLQCTVCYEMAPHSVIDAHHLKSGAAAAERGIGLKATDRRAVPLCRTHHTDLERFGSRRERQWFLGHGVDPHHLADALWRRSSDRDGEKSVDDMRALLTRFKMEAIRVLSEKERALRKPESRR